MSQPRFFPSLSPGLSRAVNWRWCFMALLLASGFTTGAASLPQQSPDGAVAQVASQEARALELGQPIERELVGGETQRYAIALAAGQFLRVVVAMCFCRC